MVLSLGTPGIDATKFRAGTIAVSVPITMVSSSACVWSIFDTTASLPSATPTFNISGPIQVHATAALQILAQRASTSTGVGTVNLTGPITGTGTGNVKYAGSNSGTNTINITGASSSYSAPTTVNAVTLKFDQLATAGTNSSFGSSGVINIGEGSSATLVNYVGATAASTDRQITFGLASGTGGTSGFQLNNNSPTAGDAGAIRFDSTASILHTTAILDSARLFQLGGTQSGPNTFSGQIVNNGTGVTSLTKRDAGYWILTNTGNTFSGGLTLLAGRLGFGSDAVLGKLGGAINFTGNANLIATGDATLEAARTVTVASGVTGNMGITSAFGTTLTVNAKITGAGSVSRTSGSAFFSGTVRFANNSNDYSGAFGSRFGITEFTSITDSGVPSALGAGSVIIADNSSSAAVLRHVGSGNSATNRPIVWSASTGALFLESGGDGTVSFLNTTPLVTSDGTKTLNLGGSNLGGNTLAQPIDNGPSLGVTSLQKSGVGKWIVTPVNHFTGDTLINEGTLALGTTATISSSPLINIAAGASLDLSAKASPFVIPSTQTLTGSGSVTGQGLEVVGIVAPGINASGTLATAAVTLSAGAAMNVQINSSGLPSSGKLAVTGDLLINPSAVLNLSDIAAVPVGVATTLTIATYTGSISGTFMGLPQNAVVTVGPNAFTISYDTGNAITLTAATAYSTWIDTFTSLIDGQKGQAADPDGDGKTNLAEFAFDDNPTSGASNERIQSSIAKVGATDHLTLSIPVRNGATFSGSTSLVSSEVDGIVYEILGSSNLSSFGETIVEITPAIVTSPALSNGWSYKSFRLSSDTSSQPRGFLRAKTSGPTP